MSNTRHIRVSVLLAAAFAIAGCASAIDAIPEKLGGLPNDAPQRPATALPTPNVYEVRPTREARPLTEAEQKKLESDLTALRESQKQRANSDPPPASPPPPPAKQAAAKDSGAKKAQGPAAPKKPADPTKSSN